MQTRTLRRTVTTTVGALFAALLAALVACSNAGVLQDRPPAQNLEKLEPGSGREDPLSAIPAIPTGEISISEISDQTVLTIDGGDFVHPAFSPDGKKLAYSRVVVERGSELTEVLVQDLAAKDAVTFLDADASRKYAVYTSFVSGMRWIDEKTLEVQIVDGDVDGTLVTFDVVSGDILSEKAYGMDEEFMESAGEKAFLDKATSAFPALRREVLRSGTHFQATDGSAVLQKRYHGEDEHIWFLDAERKEMFRLLELPEGSVHRLRGGFSFGHSIVFLLSLENNSFIIGYQGGKVSKLAEIRTSNSARLEVKHAADEGVVFLVPAHQSYERGNNPLFLFDASGLKRITEIPELYDVEIDPAGQRICLVVWENDQRHLLVMDFKR